MDYMRRCFDTASQLNFPTAIWRLPEQDTKHFIVDLSGKVQKVDPDFDVLSSGFIVHPFIETKEKDAFFIAADLHYSSENQIIKHDPDTNGYLSDKQKNKNVFLEKFHQYSHETCPDQGIRTTYTTESITDTTEKKLFISNVRQAVEDIRNKHFTKVVLSRRKMEALPSDFDVIRTFEKLCHTYPHAFVSLVYLPNEGVWLGASPEVLVRMDQHRFFQTVALAGTQRWQVGTNPQHAQWTQKEIEEQALVSRYIINCFKKIRLREYKEMGPKTVRAGNLLHLKTTFEVDTKLVRFPELATVMTDLLHPTSAVCGMPKPNALDFIAKHEKYDRALYSGFLGPVHIENRTSLFVNLRCMQLSKKHGIFYAGAGITQDSVAEKEWAETELKCHTLLNVVRN